MRDNYLNSSVKNIKKKLLKLLIVYLCVIVGFSFTAKTIGEWIILIIVFTIFTAILFYTTEINAVNPFVGFILCFTGSFGFLSLDSYLFGVKKNRLDLSSNIILCLMLSILFFLHLRKK